MLVEASEAQPRPRPRLVPDPEPNVVSEHNAQREPAMVAGWGNLPGPAIETRSEDLARITQHKVLTRGLGRSYGDSSLPPEDALQVANSTLADRILSFDPSTGLLRCEAGLSLFALNQIFLPRNFFVPVTPGTQYVTVGGMVASDVHGKNHHKAGCFGQHVERLLMRLADGRVTECGPDLEPELFWATVGGMGLTGHILEVEFRMVPIPSPWMVSETYRMGDLDQMMALLKESGTDWPYTATWIDCLAPGRSLGRGILFRSRWASPEQAPPHPPKPKPRVRVPFNFPSFTLNRLTLRMMNTVVYRGHIPKAKRGIVHPEDVFYPLDKVLSWNRAYGKKGFTQFQCVLPESAGVEAARRFLTLLKNQKAASFFCVIKDCGAQGQGMLSFPMPGISIALDIPARGNIQGIINSLNEAVLAEGGRIYLTKDRFTRADHFAAMEGERLAAFQAVRRRYDPEGRLRSAQSVRMLGDAPT